MADSQNFCCGNIFIVAKVLTIAEIVWIIVSVVSIKGYGKFGILLQLAYLAVEFYGIHKKNECLILFGCVFRILETICLVIWIIIVFYLYFSSEIVTADPTLIPM